MTDTRVLAARTARDEAMQAASDHTDARLVLTVDKVIADLNASGKPWSVNDARDALPVACSGLVGARVKAASMRRPVEMVKVGEEPSTLRSTHAKGVARWIGVQA
jgi:predicted house-cleaning NTP pyrophosphatase (Maf/HAM1 superfamily)